MQYIINWVDNDSQPERNESERGRGGTSLEHFVHVSDVESDFVPLKGDQASLDFSSNLK